MSAIDPQSLLAAIVDDHPELARELTRQGIDFCCGGQRRLVDACVERGLDPAAVVDRLGAVVESAGGAPADWVGLDLAALVDHLEATHHAYLHDELPWIDELVGRVVRAHGVRHPELREVEAGWREIRADLEPHLVKEERILFPMIRELAGASMPPTFHCGSLRNPISVMLREHDRVGALLARLRVVTAGFEVPPDACDSYRILYRGLERLEADTHLHVHKENNVLFPRVEELEVGRRDERRDIFL